MLPRGRSLTVDFASFPEKKLMLKGRREITFSLEASLSYRPIDHGIRFFLALWAPTS